MATANRCEATHPGDASLRTQKLQPPMTARTLDNTHPGDASLRTKKLQRSPGPA
ncbi:MAG: hypothetical protein OXC06_16045 [Acidimicrobiaceae bacterium]|nr:hypothetical protein [Acidimicrobiaceae bacterium]